MKVLGMGYDYLLIRTDNDTRDLATVDMRDKWNPIISIATATSFNEIKEIIRLVEEEQRKR